MIAKHTACIVMYNNDENILQKAIKSYLDSDSENSLCLYLIDNSPIDKLKSLAKISEKIVYVFNPKNPGFGAAHNIAIKMAIESGSKYHLVLNPDVYFLPNVIKDLSKFMTENPDIGNVMPKVFYPDGSVQYVCKLLPTPYDWIGRRFNPFKKIVEKRNDIFELKFTGYNEIMDVPYLSGCFMFLNLDIIKKVGFFDDNLFMYCEETDLCRRLISAGYRNVFYPHSHIFHYFGKGSHRSWKLTKIGMQSAVYYFNKWGWFFDKERKVLNNKTLKVLGK